jgi:hypothetical protein
VQRLARRRDAGLGGCRRFKAPHNEAGPAGARKRAGADPRALGRMGAPLNRTATLESQMIPMIQDVPGQILRISMTVATKGDVEGTLNEVVSEKYVDTDQPEVEFSSTVGRINADLSIGTKFSSVARLASNDGICHEGVKLHGRGFILTPQQAQHLGLGRRPELEMYIRSYRNGRNLTIPRGKIS